MSRKAIVLYWLLLLVPTLLIGAGAFQLIRHERERMAQRARSASRERAESIAQTILVAVSAIEDELMAGLREIPQSGRIAALEAWRDDNPLVRNVFVWNARSGLRYPLPGSASTTEEQRFVARFDALFSGRIPWDSDTTESDTQFLAGAGLNAAPQRLVGPRPDAVPYPAQQQAAQADWVQDINRLRGQGKQLAKLAGRKGKGEAATRPPSWRGGWLPWFEENRLHILGWTGRDTPAADVYGLELEVMALLSRIVTDFPSATEPDTVFALVDGSGSLLHQAGGPELEAGARPALAASLAPYLPHWQVAVFFTGLRTHRSAPAFTLLASLLLAIFLAAVVFGGGALAWLAHRSAMDARQKTSFVSNVSHELKTPLTNIRMYAELLQAQRVKEPAKRQRYLDVIAAESQRLTRLVNNVLDFSRLEQGRKRYNVESLNLGEYLRDFLETHKLRIEGAGLELQCDLPAHDVSVRTDRDALEQVLLNLLDNAVKYAAAGGELRVQLERRDSMCALTISDRGPGVPAAHRTRIFEKFHRVDDSLTTRQPGSGLGLSIARRLLRELGGDLHYEPRDGGGSRFLALLPAGEHIDSGRSEG